MQRFTISYTKAINQRYQRTGSLFQGAFQNKLVDRDEYLLHLSRYIHLNPVRAGLAQQPENWTYSSYQEYVGLRKATLVQPEVVLSQLSSTFGEWQAEKVYQRYQKFVQDGLDQDREISHLLLNKKGVPR